MSWMQASSRNMPVASASHWRIDSLRGPNRGTDGQEGDDAMTCVTDSSAVTQRTSHTSKKQQQQQQQQAQPKTYRTTLVSMMRGGPSGQSDVERVTGSIPLTTATISTGRRTGGGGGGGSAPTSPLPFSPLMVAATEHPSMRFDRATAAAVSRFDDDGGGLSPMASDSQGTGLGPRGGGLGGRHHRCHASHDPHQGRDRTPQTASVSKTNSIPGAISMMGAPQTPKKETGAAAAAAGGRTLGDEFYGAHFDPEKTCTRSGGSGGSQSPGRGFYDYAQKEESDRFFFVDTTSRSLYVGNFSVTTAVCFICLVVLGMAVMAVGVTVSVALSKAAAREQQETAGVAADAAAYAASSYSNLLLSPPETLSLVCAEKSLETPWGFDVCRDVCDHATCCREPIGQAGSCLEDFATNCAIYEGHCSCFDHVVAPPAPDGIMDVCSEAKSTLDHAYTECRDMCDRAKCCFRPAGEMGACSVESEADCDTYRSACSLLSESKVLPPPDDFTAVCSPRNIANDKGLEECHDVCMQASCCNLPQDDPGLCSAANYETCDMYEVACSFLPFVSFPDPPLDIMQTCAPERMSTYEGFRKCHDICDKASCCFLPKGDMGRCVDRENNLDNCVLYKTSCSFMKELQVPPPPQDIAILCTPDNVATMRGNSKCGDICAMAPCCFKQKGESGSCLETNGETCAIYQTACYVLEDMGSFENYLINICTEENVKSENGYNDCKSACDAADCCFLPSWHMDSCSLNVDKCEVYAKACYILDDSPFSEESQPSQGGQQPDIVDLQQAPIDLFEACSLNSIAEQAGFDHCSELCAPAECCEATGDDGCVADNRYTCAQYAPCVVIKQSQESGPQQVTQTEVAAAGVVVDGGDDVDVDDSSNTHNGDDNGDDTQQSSSPNRSRIENDSYEELAALVAEACEDDYATEGEFCMKYCKPYMCCFADSRSNCQRELGALCDAHAPCAALVGLWDEDSDNRQR